MSRFAPLNGPLNAYVSCSVTRRLPSFSTTTSTFAWGRSNDFAWTAPASASAATDAARSAALRRGRVTRRVRGGGRRCRGCRRLGHGRSGRAGPGREVDAWRLTLRLVGLEELPLREPERPRERTAPGTSGSSCCTSGPCRCRPAATPRSGSPSPTVRVCSWRKFSSACSSGYASATANSRPSAWPRIPSAAAVAAGPCAVWAAARACVTASNVPRSCCGVAAHRLDEVRDQVPPALELHLDLRPRVVDAVPVADEPVVQRDQRDDDQRDDDQQDDDPDHRSRSYARRTGRVHRRL